METGGEEAGTSEAARMGARIARLRAAAGLTQRALADALDVHKQSVWKWEKGVVEIEPENLRKLAGVLGVSPARILEDGAEPPSADMVSVSRETVGYLRGKLETTTDWLRSIERQMTALGTSVQAVGETLTALRSTLDQATSGVAGLLVPGEFPGPPPRDPGPSTEDLIRRAAQAGALDAPAVRTKRAAGG